jgi:hypothetical protein
MAEFKKGDKVFVKPGEVSRYGWAPKDYTTPLIVSYEQHDGLVAVLAGVLEYSFRPGQLTHALDPSKVKAGDTVTLERDGGRLPDQEVVVVTSTEQGWIILILKGAVEVRVTGPDPWRLTAHTPAPEPEPYTPTREQVRQAYVDGRSDTGLITESEAGAEFDRWFDSLGLNR